MFNYSLLLASEIQSDFLTTFLPILRYVLFGLIIASAIVMIITTLMQSNDSNNGLDAFTGGGQESYYAQNKGSSRDGKLKLITIIMGIIIFVCAVLYLASILLYSGS